MNSVRVRIAPSPTGYCHLGTARTALYNYLFARKHGGQFLVRIEDTDAARNDEAMTKGILDGLAWLGMESDESIIYQSANRKAHQATAKVLLGNERAYADFTPKDEKVPAGRDNPYRKVSFNEQIRRIKAGEPYAIRLKVPEAGEVRFIDLVFGEQVRNVDDIEDFVLLRSDGTPLYNLAVAVDDRQMNITHVIRGADHLTNTFKQVLIYDAMGWPVPQFAHLPLINAPGKKKLSKRVHGEIVSITHYQEKGFLPESVLNFLALLGWSPASGKEIMSVDEMIAEFDLARVHRHPAVFNFDDKSGGLDRKLVWMNSEYLRQAPLEHVATQVREYLNQAGVIADTRALGDEREPFMRRVDLVRRRATTLEDFHTKGLWAFWSRFPFDAAAIEKFWSSAQLAAAFATLDEVFVALNPWDRATISEQIATVAVAYHLKEAELLNAMRVALTGQGVGPAVPEIIEVLGRMETVGRLLRAYHRLTELSSKADEKAATR